MPSEKEKMLVGDSYDTNNPEPTAERKHVRWFTRRFNDTGETRIEHCEELIRELFGAVGGSFGVESLFRCDYGYNVHVDEEFFANFDCVFLGVCPITIGDNYQLGLDVHVYMATHSVDAVERIEGPESDEPVTIGDNTWFGGRAVVSPGVTIGGNTVVTSGIVVIDDVLDSAVVGGNPARVAKELD